MKLSEMIDGFVGPDAEISGISADSRAIKPGFLFAGLPGTKVDGADFIDQALENGASAVLTHSEFKGELNADTAILRSENAARDFAKAAARFYAPQPTHVAAITGTNGKTSVASFVRQIWQALGIEGASLGTIGIVSRHDTVKLNHTTPDPVTLHRALATLSGQGVTHLALEASSHGLAQYRLDGVQVHTAAFTNITRDHLDYHATFDEYFSAKKRLFSELLERGGIAVIDADAPGGCEIIELCNANQINFMTIGEKGRYLNLKKIELAGFSQRLFVTHHLGSSVIELPLVGDFQASNALVAAALVAAGDVALDDILPVLTTLKGAKGRLEHVASKAQGEKNKLAPIFIDYAHTPDALMRALEALRPFVKGRLIVVFGCGGDRDKGKRAEMGRIAELHADAVIVTDDNPRTEPAAAIRAEIMKAAPHASEIGDREEAIGHGIELLNEGDVLLVAGKGHETGQIIGSERIDFSDHEVVKRLIDGGV